MKVFPFWMGAAVVLLLTASRAFGETAYCAFEVKVGTPSGSPVAGVPVYLIRGQRATLSSTTTDHKGVATFCDAPVGPLDIGVGFDVCGSVLVRDVRATWPETHAVFVTYVDTPCAHFTFEKKCLAMFRIQDADGTRVTGARLRSSDGGSGSWSSDTYGRIFRSVERGGKIEGVITKEGAEAVHISETCTDDREVTVVLRAK